MYFNAISLYRVYSVKPIRSIKPLRKLLEIINYFLFNSTIPYSAVIGENTFCSHRGMSVVIHNKAIIGSNCIIGTCVTIGGKGKKIQGAPTIGNNVTISTGAKVLGPITIGDNSVIGANAVVLTNVPANSTAVGIPAKVIVNEN